MTALPESTQGFEHRPVLLDEIVELIVAADPSLIVDGTAGGAGHSRALLEALPEARLIALDRDPTAVASASERLAVFGGRAEVVHASFSEVGSVLAERGLARAGALLVDLGVSSHQLDTAERGFSFRLAGDLDMRMDPTSDEPAREVIAGLNEAELASAIRELGEERHAKRVARAILRELPQTTEALAELVRSVVPKGKQKIDPATRTFQAIRMLVNRELDELGAWLRAVPELLEDGGVAVAISFHSLEDRAVKRAFREGAKGCICPPELPVCACGRLPTLDIITRKPIVAGGAEVGHNPRARSAKLRAARRVVRT